MIDTIVKNWEGITAVIGGILISDIVGMSRLKANSVIELVGQTLKFLASLRKK